MTKSTVSNMFNRLPIYSRPKERAIGDPILFQSTNERLSGRAGITIVGLDGRPRYEQAPAIGISPSPYRLDSRPNAFEKGLPQIPSSNFSDEFLPPPPLSPPSPPLAPRGPSTTGDSSFFSLANVPSSSAASPPPPPPPRKFKVSRKPAPAPALPPIPVGLGLSMWSGTGAQTTITAGYTEEQRGSSGSTSLNAEHTHKAGGFTLGNLVKEHVTGRRKLSSTMHAEQQAPLPGPGFGGETTTTVKPAGLNSIDDWLDSREGLHKRTNTVTSTSTQYSRLGGDPLKLHIRQSTFAPLQPPQEFTAEETMPSMPSIPLHFLSKSAPQPQPQPQPPPPVVRQPPLPHRETIPEPDKRSTQQPPSPPITPDRPRKPTEPLDHIGQLEWEQEELEFRKKMLRKEIYDLELLLPPNPSTHSKSTRQRMNTRLEELNQEYLDAEKLAHDLGLKLYRAYRRRDKRDGTEGPTHLWVSRVTAPQGD